VSLRSFESLRSLVPDAEKSIIFQSKIHYNTCEHVQKTNQEDLMTNIVQSVDKAKVYMDDQLEKAGTFLDHHPTLYKAVLVASHIFRAASMYALMAVTPLHPLLTCGLLLGPALIYRAAVERFCCFRFALPSVLGAVTFWAARAAAIAIVTGQVFTSPGIALLAGLGLASLAGYGFLICYISHVDIKKRMATIFRPKCCCD
jgi:hypothetical protein